MSDTTKIEWATATWNPWEGCTKVSPGCVNCYAAARNHRFGMDNWGKGKPRRRTSAANWKKPLAWNREAAEYPFRCSICGNGYDAKAGYDGPFFCQHCSSGDNPVTERTVFKHRPRIFPSLCDWLDDEVPAEWLADFLKLIHDTPNLDWLLLTKRPENFRPRLESVAARWQETISDHGRDFDLKRWISDWLNRTLALAPSNIWLGVSVENQRCADERIPELLSIPAKVRFLSVEPLLEAVDINHWMLEGGGGGLDWVIVGGESGPGARPCDVQWIRGIVTQCRAAGVPCFVKQLGSKPFADVNADPQTGEGMLKLKHPKGGDMAEWPADLQVREFPRT